MDKIFFKLAIRRDLKGSQNMTVYYIYEDFLRLLTLNSPCILYFVKSLLCEQVSSKKYTFLQGSY